MEDKLWEFLKETFAVSGKVAAKCDRNCATVVVQLVFI
jgi:hypothetical protein